MQTFEQWPHDPPLEPPLELPELPDAWQEPLLQVCPLEQLMHVPPPLPQALVDVPL
jgi:hypothetical protein